MAAKTTTGAGNWSAAIWTPAGTPGNGDTVTIAHNVTVDVDVTVGDSGTAGGTAAIRCNGGNLTKPDGVNLTIRGDFTCANYYGATFGTGVVEFDASLAASPSTTSYKFETGYRGKLTATGTTFRSNAGGANARMLTTYANDYTYLTDCTFQRMGLSTGSGMVFAGMEDSASGDVVLLRCTFDANCGSVITGTNQATSRFEIIDCEFNQSVGQTDSAGFSGTSICWRNNASSTPTGAGTRLVTGNRLNLKAILNSAVGFTVDRCVFMVPPYVGTAWVEFKRSFLRHNDSSYFVLGGGLTDTYHLCDTTTPQSNWHACGLPNESCDFAGLIFDPFTADQATDTGEMLITPASATATKYVDIERCILLPSQLDYLATGQKAPCGALINDGSAGSTTYRISARHNTVYCMTPTLPVFGNGENGIGVACYDECRSNLIWAPVAGKARMASYYPGVTGTPDDLIAAGAATHNAVFNGVAGTGSNGPGFVFTATTPAGADTITTDPELVDGYRSIASWATSLSLSGSTAAELKDSAIAYLWADPTRLDALMAHVRAGQAPTNAAYQADHESSVPTTSPTNGWIGAVEGVVATPPSSGMPLATLVPWMVANVNASAAMARSPR